MLTTPQLNTTKGQKNVKCQTESKKKTTKKTRRERLINQDDRSSMVNAFFDYPLQKDKFIEYKKKKTTENCKSSEKCKSFLNSNMSLFFSFMEENLDIYHKFKFINALDEFSFTGILDNWNENIQKNKYSSEAINKFKLDSFVLNILVLEGFLHHFIILILTLEVPLNQLVPLVELINPQDNVIKISQFLSRKLKLPQSLPIDMTKLKNKLKEEEANNEKINIEDIKRIFSEQIIPKNSKRQTSQKFKNSKNELPSNNIDNYEQISNQGLLAMISNNIIPAVSQKLEIDVKFFKIF